MSQFFPRETRLELFDFRLHALDHAQWIFAIAHQDDTAHRFHAGLIERAAAKVWAERNRGHIFHLDRRAFFLSDYDFLQVIHCY